jgi:transposase
MTQTSSATKTALGIDVSKATMDVAMWQVKGESKQVWRGTFANTQAGITKLLRELSKRAHTPVHACMEATGRYHERVAEMLHAAGYTVSVVNPAQLKHFREEGLVRNKTDGLDAVLLMDYCAQKQPRAWTPPVPEIKLLQAFYARYDDLVAMRTQEINRLKAGDQPATMQTMIEDSIAHLNGQIEQVVQLINDHIDRHPSLRERSQLLESIDSIARLTAGRLIAFQIDQFESPASLAAYAGVSPRINTSGTLRKPARMCRTGHNTLRTALYMPALSSLQHNAVIKRLAERLKKRGLKGKQIVVAAMHKLLHLAWGVLKTQAPFDPDWATP